MLAEVIYNKAMSAAKSQKNPDIPADLQQYYNAPSKRGVWARWAVRIVALIILICLAIMFVKWVWHQTHTGDNKKPATSSTQTEDRNSSSRSTEPITLGGDTPNGDEPSSSSTPAPTGGNTGAAAQSVGQSTKLTNTGPGQTIGIFIAVSLFSALLYEIRLRKLN